MALKLMKFHGILHMVHDMLAFGPPVEVDTGSNEEHHKGSKAAAQQTQKKKDEFNQQTLKRMDEYEVLRLAMAEMEGLPKLWEHLDECETDSDGNSSQMSDSDDTNGSPMLGIDEQSNNSEEKGPLPINQGPMMRVGREEENDEPTFKFMSRGQDAASTKLETMLIEFLVELQDKVDEHIPERFLPVFTGHKRGGQIFRGHPNWMGTGPWRGWALLDWGRGYGTLPVHIWAFIELNGIPENSRIEHGGIYLADGTDAVVESSTISEDEDQLKMSDIFLPIIKDIGNTDEEGQVTERVFYLADVEAIVGPCCVIPDIGGAPNHYFQVKARSQWVEDFIAWLEDAHVRDDMGNIEDD